jgi:hypothetical protein
MNPRNIFIISLLLISSSHVLFPMQAAINWLPKIGKGAAAFGILFPAFMDTLYAIHGENKKQKREAENLPDMPPKTSELIYKIAQECGISSKEIKLKVCPDQGDDQGDWHDWHVNRSNVIFGGPEKYIKEIEKDLADGKTIKDSIVIQDAITAIKHELGHIAYKDRELIEKMPFAYALGAYAGINAIVWSVQKIFGFKKPTSLWAAAASAAFNIGVLAPFYWNMSNELRAMHSRFIESRADAFALKQATSREELEFSSKFYKSMHENAKTAFDNPEVYGLYQNPSISWRYSFMKKIHNLTGSGKSMGQWLEQYPWLFQFVDSGRDSDHPIAFKRMKAAEKALKQFDR